MLVAREGESVCFKSVVSARLTCAVCACTHVYLCGCACAVHTKVISLPPTLYGFWGSNSGLEALVSAPLPTEPSWQCRRVFFFRKTEVAE